MPTLNKCGYDEKRKRKFLAFAKRTLKQDVRNAFLAADLKVKIEVQMAPGVDKLIVIVSELARNSSYGMNFNLSFFVDGSVMQKFKYFGPINFPPNFKNTVFSDSDRVSRDSIISAIYDNGNTNREELRVAGERVHKIESFDNRVADAMIVIGDAVEELVTEFERT